MGIVSCSSDPTGSGSGNFSILITDAPIDLTQVEEVRVVLDEFLVYPGGRIRCNFTGGSRWRSARSQPA